MANTNSSPVGAIRISPPDGFLSSVKAEADRLLADGFTVVMLGYQSKAPPPVEPPRFDTATGKPILMKREKCLVTQDNIDQLLGNQPRNIGVLLGAKSNNRVDIDLDWTITRPLAKLLFENAPCFGRLSAKSSHIIVACPGAKTLKFLLPTSMKDNDRLPDKHSLCVLELRSDGHHTVFPSSVHQDTGEAIAWEIKGDFPTFEFQALKAKLGLLAFLSAVAQFWPIEGTRDDTAMALAGALLASGLDAEEADFFARAVAQEAGDEEWQKRGKAVATDAKMQAGEAVTGLPKLVELLGLPEACVATFRDWLGIKGGPPRRHHTGGRNVIDPKRTRDLGRRILSERFTFNGELGLVFFRSEFHIFDAGYYRAVEPEVVKSAIYEVLEGMQEMHPKYGPQPMAVTPRLVRDVEDGLKTLCLIEKHKADPPDWIRGGGPPPGELLVLRNGLFHLPKGELLPHTPRFFTLSKIDIDYDSTAQPPARWLRLMDEIWPDDPEAIATLQEMIGYFLVPDNSQQKAFLFIGPPRSGKGTIARMCEMLLGSVNYAGIKLKKLGDQFGMESLIPKLLAVVTDARLGAKTDRGNVIETVLTITGQDGVTIDRKGIKAWEGTLKVRFFIHSNELPRFEDMSGAFASRFIALKTEQTFMGREDLDLGDKLKAELPGVLLWAIEGRRRLKGRGKFVQPASSAAMMRHFELMSSPVKGFIEDRCVLDPQATVAKDALYQAYKYWQETEGKSYSLDKQSFANKLYAAFPGLIKEGRPSVEGERVRVFRGVRLRTPEDDKAQSEDRANPEADARAEAEAKALAKARDETPM